MAYITLENLRGFAGALADKIVGTFVKKEVGKGLSTNDYTNTEKETLATVAKYMEGVTEKIQTLLNAKASLASPILTGTPKAPTASAETNTTQIATTAFVKTAIDRAHTNKVNYGTCSTAASTTAKTVACTGFSLVTGAEITVKFTNANTATNPTLNVNGTGAKPIYYRGSAISSGSSYIRANGTYTFRYNGTQWDFVGDIDTNSNTWQANSKTASGYVTKGEGQVNKVWGTDADGNPGWVDKSQIPSGLTYGYVRTGQRTSETTGDYSTAEGYNTSAPNKFAHSEGHSSVASGNTSHAEGWESTASGTASHAEGRLSFAEGYVSHAEGTETTSSANNCHAEGYKTAASSHQAHAEGNSTKAEGENSHAEGRNTKATTENSHAEGLATTVSGYTSHAEGWNSTASGNTCHAEGYHTTAAGDNSHTEGKDTKAYGKYCHAEGYNTEAGEESHLNDDIFVASHAEGKNTRAMGIASHTEGYDTETQGSYCHSEGESTSTDNMASHSEGGYTYASDSYSHAEGYYTRADKECSHSEGSYTIANNYASHVCGKYNKSMVSGGAATTQIGDVFVVGNGTTLTARSNALRVTYLGDILGTKAFQSSGADYAEFIKPWADGNPEDEDRVGYLVTVNDGLLHKAEEGDYIVGITSGNPSIVGNADEDYYWRYERDEFNRIIMEDEPEMVQKTEVVQEAVPKTEIIQKPVQKTELIQEPAPSTDEDGNPVISYVSKEITTAYYVPTKVPVLDEDGSPVIDYVPTKVPVYDDNGEPVMEYITKEVPVYDENGNPVMVETGNIIPNARMKLSESYDPSLQDTYIERKYRKEWDYVGMLGVLPVRDDGTCVPGSFCKCGKGGIATLAQERGFDTYMVLERVSVNVVKVVLK